MGFKIGEIDLGLALNKDSFNKDLKGLANSAKQILNKVFKPVGGLVLDKDSFNKDLRGLAHSTQQTAANAFKPVGRIIGAALAGGALVKFTKDCLDLGSDLTEVQNVVDTTFGSMSSKADEFAKSALETFGMSEKVAKQYMGTLGAMSKSMGFSTSEAYNMAEAVTGLTGDVASFYNLSSDEAFDKLKSIWTGETETFKSIGVLLTQTNLDQYALNNGFGKTTAKMTEQEKVLLRYQYTLSALSDASGDFAKTQDSWANQTRILSLQFDSLKTTLGQGFINLFTPILQVINSLLAKLSLLANKFKEFTTLLMGDRGGGSQTSTVGTIVSDSADAAAGLNNVTDAAKEAAKATGLLKIDNLNNITTSSSTSSSAGSTGTGGMSEMTDAAQQTEGVLGEVDARMAAIVEKADEFIARLKTIGSDLKAGDFFKAGRDTSDLIADIFNMYSDAVDKVSWSDIGAKMAQFLNGAITPKLFSAAGRSVASSLNAAIHTALGFGTTFDFKNLGESIASGINTFFDTFDFAGLGQTVGTWVGGIKDTGVKAIRNIDWGKAIKGAWDFTINLGGENIALILGAITIKKIMSAQISVAAIRAISKKLGQELASSIGVEIGKDSGIGAALGAGIKKSVASMGGIGSMLTMDSATVLGAGSAMEIGTFLGASIIGGITAAIGGWNLGQFLYEKLSGIEIDMSWTEQFAYLLKAPEEDFDSFVEGLTTTLTDFENNPVLTMLADLLAGPFVTGAAYIHKNSDAIAEDMDKLKDDFKALKDKIGEKWDGVERWFNEDVSPWFTKEKWSTFGSNMNDSIQEKWNDFSKWWGESGVSKWFEESVRPWFTKDKWTSAMSGIKEGFQETFKGACNIAIEKFNALIQTLNEKTRISWDAVKVAGKEIFPAVDIQLLNLSKIPLLANGGYVGPNQPQLAMIGDNRTEGEVVAPESKLLDMAQRAAAMSGGSKEEMQLLKEIIELLKAILDKPGLSDSDVGKAARRFSQEYSRRTGSPAYY